MTTNSFHACCIQAMFINRKKSKGKEIEDKDKAFASNMAGIFDTFERAVPRDFRGYFKGDLLYYNTPPVTDKNFGILGKISKIDSQTSQKLIYVSNNKHEFCFPYNNHFIKLIEKQKKNIIVEIPREIIELN